MGFPRSVMDPSETLLVHVHPHWRGLVRPAVFVWVVTALSGVAGGLVEGQVVDESLRSLAWLVLAGVWVTVVGMTVLRPIRRWARTDLVVTDRRVLYRPAGLWRRGIDLPLGRVSAVRYRYTLFERMLGTGTLLLERGYLPPVEIDDVPHVAEVHATVYDELERIRVARPRNPVARLGRRLWPLPLRSPDRGRMHG